MVTLFVYMPDEKALQQEVTNPLKVFYSYVVAFNRVMECCSSLFMNMLLNAAVQCGKAVHTKDKNKCSAEMKL